MIDLEQGQAKGISARIPPQAIPLLVVIPLFLASYVIALTMQQTVTLLVAKQLGGRGVSIRLGEGRVLRHCTLRGRPVELRARWWTEPRYEWMSGMGSRRNLFAGLAGVGINLLLVCLGLLDLRHRRSRGLWINTAAHAAAVLTAAVWALT